jgi:hypothetical protein
MLTVPVKYVRNDNITPFSRVDCTRALTIMPGTSRSIEIPLRSLVCTAVQHTQKKKSLIRKETVREKAKSNDKI